MKHVLLVGHSMMTAHNMARDLIERNGETVYQTFKRDALPFIETEEGNFYYFLAHFEVQKKERQLRGRNFDNTFFMSDFSAGLVEDLKAELAKSATIGSLYLVKPDAIGFEVK